MKNNEKSSRERGMKRLLSAILSVVLLLSVSDPLSTQAASLKCIDTKINYRADAVGEYSNWEGTPNVCQFTDKDGNFCFCYDKSDKKAVIVMCKDGKVKKKITIKKAYPLFGAICSDKKGNFYLVTGRENKGDDSTKKTVFVTKYNSKGKLIKTVGNDGSSSLAYYYGDSFNTRRPFDAGNCNVAVNGNYLAVNYARGMYNGHQSNSVWFVKLSTMKTVKPKIHISDQWEDYDGSIVEYVYDGEYEHYNSHSFGQRVIPYKGGFAFMSEGDAYPRAFTYSSCLFPDPKETDTGYVTATEYDIFHFGIPKGHENDMFCVNDNAADLGDINVLKNGNVSFVAISAKSMSGKLYDQKKQLFIQIFNPAKDLSKASAYVTSGKRSGLSGETGTEAATDYGVKWLTNYSDKYIDHPQAVTDGKGNTIILFERYDKNKNYEGVYLLKTDKKGKVTKKITRISKTARLNPCETPVYSKGYVYWVSNEYQGYYYDTPRLNVYRYKI